MSKREEKFEAILSIVTLLALVIMAIICTYNGVTQVVDEKKAKSEFKYPVDVTEQDLNDPRGTVVHAKGDYDYASGYYTRLGYDPELLKFYRVETGDGWSYRVNVILLREKR